MSHEPESTEATTDAVRPSWAAHELAALALTVVLAVWVVAQWGATVQPNEIPSETKNARKRWLNYTPQMKKRSTILG